MLKSAASKVIWVQRARKLAYFVLALMVALCIGVLLEAREAHAKTFTVNSTGDGSDFALDGRCDASPTISVVCTLRAAIQVANDDIRNPGLDTINFNIPTTDPNCNATTGVCTISPASALPDITEAVSINGYSQRPCSSGNAAPCSKPNSSAVGTNAVLLIQLNGANTTSSIGLIIEASNSVVQGLVINRFGAGISIARTASVNSTATRIEGNFIGTNASGTADLGNSFVGAHLSGSNNTVGGTSPAARNLISGNGRDGVVTQNGSGNQVLGNLIGTDRTGTQDLGNDGAGVLLSFSKQTVGGDTAASANVIAFNGQDGVAVINSAATGNDILRNSIFSNGDLGIDLGDDGRTANDPGDADTGTGGLGGNNFQNFPILSSAETVGATTTIKGRLNSTPNKTFTLRFFSNPSGNEGKKFIGTKSVTTNSSGNTGTFTFVPNQSVGQGQRITATATDPGGNTSEFSAVREVTGGTIG